ncbi:MAG: LytTR family DNA-binding domain-containing protein, partial [Cyclobacteriaceae bacterium]
QKIFLSEILYLESDKDFVKIHCSDKVFMELQTLKYHENHLPENFIRVHKSYLINKDKIDKVESSRLFIGKTAIPIGRNFKDQFYKSIGL